jgi:hypothetical protein
MWNNRNLDLVMDLDMTDGSDIGLQKLDAGFLKARVRARLTTDSGKSVMTS